jgi:hypothetical protein
VLPLIEEPVARSEFEALFPEISTDRTRTLVAQIPGWLGSWVSADDLLRELTEALEEAEARADVSEQRVPLHA